MSPPAQGRLKTKLILLFASAVIASIGVSFAISYWIGQNPQALWVGASTQAVLLALMLGAVFGYLSKYLFRRLKALEAAAVEQIQGNLNARVRREGPEDELDLVAQALNRLIDVVTANKEELLLHQTALQESANDVYITDKTGHIIWVNRAFTLSTGYELLEVFMQSPRILKSGEHDSTFYETLWKTILSGKSFQSEMINRRKDGSLFPHDITITPVHSESGELTHFIAIGQDVSARKKAEEKLHEATDRFEQIAANIHGVFWMTDATREHMFYVNQAYEKLSGRSRESLMKNPMSWKELIVPEDRERILSLTSANTASARESDLQYRIRAENGSIKWIRARSYPIRNDEGDVVRMIGFVEDITRQKEIEFKMIQQKELIHSSKMIALGEMAGGIAHEINTPLGALVLEAEMLAEHAEPAPPTPPGGRPRKSVADRARHILQITERISKIVRGLRSFAREGANDPFHPHSLSEILHDTLAFCSEKLRRMEIELSLSEIPADLTIECRASQISQVILNLLNNAGDAIQDLTEKWIRITVEQNAESVIIAVTDSGGGIPEEVRAKLFQPFFTTKEIGKGTGLGLSISKGIVESHSGKFFIDTACKHTRFIVQLPKSHPTHP